MIIENKFLCMLHLHPWFNHQKFKMHLYINMNIIYFWSVDGQPIEHMQFAIKLCSVLRAGETKMNRAIYLLLIATPTDHA